MRTQRPTRNGQEKKKKKISSKGWVKTIDRK